ncbi:MAG TPA: response regulator, partial [Polyangiaceae bacterium]|nr:response regulator [Polyangiaceae bacterium]
MTSVSFARELSRLELLRRVDVALNQRESPKAALSNVLRLLMPGICQQGVLEIDELDGSSSLVTAFVDPALEELALEIHRRYPPKPTVHLSEVAARTGETRFANVTDELMASIAHDSEHLALLRQFRATQLLVMPLRRDGRSLGVLALGTDHGMEFGAEDRVLAELVASRIAVHLDCAYFRRRVLLVEDNPAHRYLLRRTLELAGFDVREAETGGEALRHAREQRPDIIVLDVHLPDILGFDVCKQLKADERTARIPVIQLSAMFVSAEDRLSARAHGADEFLIAPVEPGDLVATVHSTLRSFDEKTDSRRSVERERLARVELEHANARLRAITESGLLGTFEWGSDGVILDA